MLKKNKNQKKQVFRYFEDKPTIWAIFIKILKDVGWLSKIHFNNGDNNLFKVNGRTYLSGISQFIEEMLLEINITRHKIGKQILKFTFEEDKHSTFIEMFTKVELEDTKTKKANVKKLIASLQNNWLFIDKKIRDELERRGLKSYF